MKKIMILISIFIMFEMGFAFGSKYSLVFKLGCTIPSNKLELVSGKQKEGHEVTNNPGLVGVEIYKNLNNYQMLGIGVQYEWLNYIRTNVLSDNGEESIENIELTANMPLYFVYRNYFKVNNGKVWRPYILAKFGYNCPVSYPSSYKYNGGVYYGVGAGIHFVHAELFNNISINNTELELSYTSSRIYPGNSDTGDRTAIYSRWNLNVGYNFE